MNLSPKYQEKELELRKLLREFLLTKKENVDYSTHPSPEDVLDILKDSLVDTIRMVDRKVVDSLGLLWKLEQVFQLQKSLSNPRE